MIVTQETMKYFEAYVSLTNITEDWRNSFTETAYMFDLLKGFRESIRLHWKLWCKKNGVQWNENPRLLAHNCLSLVQKERDSTPKEDAHANHLLAQCERALGLR